MSTKRRNYTSEFKAKIALDAIRGDLSINEISTKYGVHSTQIARWKQQGLLSLKTGFSDKQEKADVAQGHLVDQLYRQIGQLTCENAFLKKSVWN
jgi:transposase